MFKSKKLLIISLLLICIFSISMVSASDVSDIDACVDESEVSVYTSNVDVTSSSDSVTLVDNWADLKSNCENENGSQNIKLNNNLAPESQILINHNVVITGSTGTYIGGSDESNIATYSYVPFYTTASNVNITLKNLKFQNCGGNILMQFNGNGNYILDNCSFYNVNATNSHQSVVYLNLGEGIIENCNFTKCTTSFGTVTNHNAASTTNVHMVVRNCNFEDNYATTEPGAINNCGQLEVYNSNFTRNGAYWWAGAIHTHYRANTTIVGSIFKDNVAGWNGGALYTYSTLSIFNSTFIGNNCTTNNGGGAIGAYNYGSNFDILIDNCYFVDNNNTCKDNGRGGAISTLGAGKLQIYNTDFTNNDAAIGRTIAVYGSSSTTFIYHNGKIVDPKGENGTIAINGDVNVSVTKVTVSYVNETGNETNDTNGSTGGNSSVVVPPDYADKNTPTWNATLSDNLAGTPVIGADGNIYVPNGQYVYCYYSNGTLKWNFTTQWGYFHELAIYNNNNNNLLFAPASGDTLYILNINDGTLVANFTNNYQASSYFAPVGDNETIYISSEYGYGDDENLWIAMVKFGDTASVKNTYYYAGSICQIDNVPYGTQALLSAPVLDGQGNIWVNTIYGLMCVNLSNGQTIVSNITGVIGTPIVGSNGVIYYLGNNSKVYARNATGELWNVNINGTSGTTLIIDSTNSTLYTVSAEGYIYKIDIGTHKAQLWYNESINPVSSAIVWANNVLYVGDDQGIVWAINDENHVIWAFNASSAIVGGFAIKNDTIYAGNSNGTFYALPIANTFQSLDVQSLLKNNIIMGSVLSVSNKPVLGSITYKNIYVSPNGTGDGSSIDNPIALKNVTEISSNTIVHFADGFYTLNEAKISKIVITSQNNIVFQADNPGKAHIKFPCEFYGKSSNLTIKGLVFTAPDDYYRGHVVYTKLVSNILIDSCIFENSKRTGFVSCDGLAYNITINNCTFKNFVNPKNTGLVTPCFVMGSNVSVINCNFQNISLYDRGGTLLYLKGLGVIENCTFINNSIRIYNKGATDRGAIVKMFPVYEFPGESYLTNSVFQNNSCRHDVLFETKGYLKNNTFDKGIANFDYGVRLFSATTTVVLDNKTVDCVVGDTVRINATLKLLSPITNITSYQFYFLINNEKCFPSDWGVGVYYYDYKVTKADLITISAVCETVPYTLIYTGALHARLASNISLENVSSIKYGDNVTLVANLPSEVTGNVTFTINGENYTAGVKDGVSRVTINNLGAGSYNVSAKYLGDLTYSTSVSNTVSFNVSKVNSTMNINVKDINFGEIAIITVNLPVSSTGNVTFIINNKNYTASVKDGVAKLELGNLTSGTYNIIAKYDGDNNYNPCENTASFKVNKLESSLKITVSDVKIGEDVIITVNAPKDATGSITFDVNGKIETVSLKNGVATLTLPKVKSGEYNISVTYAGDDNYLASSNSTSFKVNKLESNLVIDIGEVKLGEDVIINVKTQKDATGTVTITINNIKEVINLVNGSATYTLSKVTAGVYNISAIYSGDDKYLASSNNTSFAVNKFNSTVLVNVSNIRVGDEEIITIVVPNDATGVVEIIVNGKKETLNLTGGVASLVLDDLVAGNYNVTVNYSGDDKYLASSNSTSFTVSKIDDYQIIVATPGIIAGENGIIYVSLPDGATGTITVKINNKTYVVNVTGDVTEIAIDPLEEGVVMITTTYSGDNKYASKVENGNITVVHNPKVNLDIENITMIYHDGTRLIAKLTDFRGKPIVNATLYFTINGQTYNKTTDANGTASMGLNLVSNIYEATVSYKGSDKFDAVSKNITVTINPTIVADNLVKMYQNATRFYAKFTDSTGKALANTLVKFNIHGVFYNKTTDKDGVADLGIMLRPGSYILTAYNPVTGEEKGFNITVKSLIMQNDLTKYYLNASKFQATVYNKDGSLAVGKNVTFNINGVFYTKTTDSNGVASLGIALRPGEYTITTMFEGLDIGNKVNVLPTLVTKDLSMKYLDGSNFTALTLDGQGKPLANQNVSFNVNGVFYHKVTNNDGIASLGIRLMSGEYIITSYWNDFQTGNTIKISP